MKLSESGRYRIVADPSIDLRRSQKRMSKQFLNGANISAAFEQVRCKAVTQHVGVHRAELGAPSNFFDDMSQSAASEGAVGLGPRQVDSLEEFVEFALCCSM